MSRGAGNRRRRAGPALADQGQNAAAKIVSIQALIRIRLILGPRKTAFANPSLELRTRARQQWPREPAVCEGRKRGHRRNSWKAAATKQLQQHRFELVVGMMRSQQDLAFCETGGEELVARFARGRFERHAGCALNSRDEHFQRHVEAASESAAVCAPLTRGGVQTVIHMDRTKPEGLAPARGKSRKQRRRVNSAAQGNTQCDIGKPRHERRELRGKPVGTELARRRRAHGIQRSPGGDRPPSHQLPFR